MSGLACLVLALAAMALPLVLLNARDRRRDRAVAAVLDACPRALRSAIALRARAPLLSRRVPVVLDMSYCDHAEIWTVVRPLAGALLPDVAVVIGVHVDPARPTTVSVACAAPGSR